MLDQIHDLLGLSSRPSNLGLIQNQVGRIEEIHRRGGRVGVADLYEGLVQDWACRDDPKHRLDRDHKLRLMEHLAHRLWSRKQKGLDYRELEDWLLDQLAADSRAQLRYRAYLDWEGGLGGILQENLRNASFSGLAGGDELSLCPHLRHGILPRPCPTLSPAPRPWIFSASCCGRWTQPCSSRLP